MKRKPPHLRQALAGSKKTCHTCKSMNRVTGLCARYSYPVKRSETCDKWIARKGK